MAKVRSLDQIPVALARQLLREAFAHARPDPQRLTQLRKRLDRVLKPALAEFLSEAQTAPPPEAGRRGLAAAALPRTDTQWYRLLLHVLLRALARQHIVLPEHVVRQLPAVLSRYDVATLRPLLGAAIRIVVGRPMKDDLTYLDTWVAKLTKETSMATTTFYIDDSSIPVLRDAYAKEQYLNKIQADLTNRFGLPAAQADTRKSPLAATIVGMVLLDGEYSPTASSLQDALRRAWLVAIDKIPRYPTGEAPLSEVFKNIADTLPSINGGKSEVSYQELAYVAREIIDGAQSIPFGHPSFMSAIRIALDHYVETRSTGDSLSLPPGSLPGSTGDNGGDPDLNADNIRVTGVLYAMALFERTLIFKATDRVAETYMIGLQPFGQGAAGKALNDYYWDSEDRLNESQRRSVFSRVLGMPGGEISREVQPNKDFEALFMRFLATAQESVRQREVDRMFQNRRPVLSMIGEQVRKAALDLAKNASLYSWGGSIYLATRLNQHLQRAIDILSMPEVLKAYAASNHWQVVERVSQQDFGGTPNYVKYGTMAQAAKSIFDILAAYTGVLTVANSNRPFLYDPDFDSGNEDGSGDGDVSREDTHQLLLSVQQWLAVNGVGEEQVQKYSQPVEVANLPSLPGGVSIPGAGKGGNTDVVDKLKQLVANGGTPSADQLQQLLTTLQ